MYAKILKFIMTSKKKAKKVNIITKYIYLFLYSLKRVLENGRADIFHEKND